MALAELAAELAGAERALAGPRPAVVLVLHEEGPRALVMQIADRLLGSRTPGLFLTQAPETLRDELEPHGLLVEPIGADRAHVARVLHALAARQAAVDMLSTELRVARASQGGLTGEISRLHDELQLAGTVQRRFLPKTLPEVAGYDFGVLYRPCGYVSGDFYDVVRLDDRRLAFMIADAVGHGVPAALLTLVLGRALRQGESHANGDCPLGSPARTLSRLNAELCLENEAGDRFATAICGVLNTETHRLTLASAGHPAPILLSRAGRTQDVGGGQGPLLGVFQQAEFPETSLDLRAGETLLLFTDGFETAFPERSGPVKASLAYVGRFSHMVAGADRSAGGIHEALRELASEIDEEAGSLHQRDDLTAFALRRLDTAAEARAGAPIRARAA